MPLQARLSWLAPGGVCLTRVRDASLMAYARRRYRLNNWPSGLRRNLFSLHIIHPLRRFQGLESVNL